MVASIVLGIALGAAALTLAARGNSMWATAGAALLLSAAILSHHFTSMGGVQIVLDPRLTIDPFTFDNPTLRAGDRGHRDRDPGHEPGRGDRRQLPRQPQGAVRRRAARS